MVIIGMKIFGIVGTAKNTGKTTALLEAAKFFYERGNRILLTSIGYDGEDFDNITGLPKPRVIVPKGALVASALPLLESSSANFDNLLDTGIRCALGRVYLGCATTSGKVVLAGPTGTRDLASVLRLAPQDSAVLLDGAFSRLSPMVVADSLILATGAARSPNSHQIADEINAIFEVMGLPLAEGQPKKLDAANRLAGAPFRLTNVGGADGQVNGGAVKISGGLFLAGQGQELGWRLNDDKDIYMAHVSGIVSPMVFQEALTQIDLSQRRGADRLQPLSFIFDHPIMLLLSGDNMLWEDVLNTLIEAGCKVMVKDSARLLGVAINSYMPSQLGTGKYIATYVPPQSFLEDITNLSRAPCTDLKLEGPGKFHSWLEKAMS